jgi:hypothetical protein
MPRYNLTEKQLVVIKWGWRVFVFDTPVVLFCYKREVLSSKFLVLGSEFWVTGFAIRNQPSASSLFIYLLSSDS